MEWISLKLIPHCVLTYGFDAVNHAIKTSKSFQPYMYRYVVVAMSN